MNKFFESIEQLFFWLLKAVHYFMKVSFGIVAGVVIGLLLHMAFEGALGKILLLSFSIVGLIFGIIYAIKSKKKGLPPYD